MIRKAGFIMTKTNAEYQKLLDKCIAFHGHLCMGQVLGVRVAIKGMELALPLTPRDIIVAVENERCLADAILTVSGTRLGRRTLKLYKYGKMAATFLNCKTGRAFRVRVNYQGAQPGDDETAMRTILCIPDEEIVTWEEVKFELPEFDLPGLPKRVVECSICGEQIFDGKDTIQATGPVCIPCMHGAYYSSKL
jgi:formylmethanofuran dehydrogenase subunit E